MAVLLFKLSNVPDDEAQEVRELLDAQGLDYYETTAGRWRLGVDAIWLSNNEDAEMASQLLYNYQQERLNKARQEQADLQARGLAPRFVDKLASQPGKVLLSGLGILAILALGLIPVLWLLFYRH